MFSDHAKTDSVLPRVAKTMRLKARLEEVKAAIAKLDEGHQVRLAVGNLPIRLSDVGRVDITFAVQADLQSHQREIEEELSWRAGE